MIPEEKNAVEQRFKEYVQRYMTGSEDHIHAVELKYRHSFLVRDEAVAIAMSERMSSDDVACASIAGLLHDFGRFEQYERYGTFSDARSENHALLGVREIESTGILNDIDPEDQELIQCAIEQHNRPAVSPELSERCVVFAKILRDADKLDIWRVMTEYYERKDRTFRSRAIELDLPDTAAISPAVLQDVHEGHMVAYHHARTVNDFKLLQMGWVYDLNFRYSFAAVRDRRYLERILEALPKTSEVLGIYERLRTFVANKATTD